MARLNAVTQTDIAQLVADKNAIFQPEGPRIPGDPRYQDRPTNATPRAMKLLLDELKTYTEEVRREAQRSGLDQDGNVAQWDADMTAWQQRLNHYYEVLRRVDPAQADTLQGADEIYFAVTSPLLDGVYYEVLPGTNLSTAEKERMKQGPPAGFSNPKPNDIYMPFSLGNQVLEYKEHQRERWDQLWKDVGDGLANIPKAVQQAGWAVAPWLIGIGVAVASGAVAGGIIYGIIKWREAEEMQRAGAMGGAMNPYALPPVEEQEA